VEVIEAIKTRRSIRAFKPEPAPTEVLMAIMETAVRAPSGVNAQPWEFYIVKGRVLDELRAACVEQVRQGLDPEPDLPLANKKRGEKGLQGVYRDRQVTVAKQIFEILGIGKGDDRAMQEYTESMYRFYDAPAAIILVMDESLKMSWPVIDMGVMCQTIALIALEYGLGTCIMRAMVDYPEVVRRVVGIPESKKVMVGLAIGYPDWEDPLNQLITEREKVENLVSVVE